MKKGFVTVKDVQATVAKAVDKAVDEVEKALQAAQQAVLGSILPCALHCEIRHACACRHRQIQIGSLNSRSRKSTWSYRRRLHYLTSIERHCLLQRRVGAKHESKPAHWH